MIEADKFLKSVGNKINLGEATGGIPSRHPPARATIPKVLEIADKKSVLEISLAGDASVCAAAELPYASPH
jgi:hypothetical protein